MPLEPLLIGLLCWIVFPLWLAAGGADWLLHRRSRIEQTSGTRESRLHMLAFFQVAIPVIAGLFLRIDALLLTVFGVSVAAHMATSLIDTSRSQPLRYISPLEQQVHSYLEMLPLFGLAIVLVLHADEWRDPDWTLAARATPLPAGAVIATLLALFATFILIGEEWWRCARRESCASASALRSGP
jgi:hypothetical protein